MLDGLLLVALALAGLHGANAQISSNATCLPSWADLYNSKGQSPCLVAAYLAAACNGGQYSVSAIEKGQHYIGPTADLVTPCLCSSVTYMMMGACSTCQNTTVITWEDWSSACSDVYFDTYPEDINQDTAVPGWAFENVTASNDIFNPSNALSDNAPESTATRSQTTQTGTGTNAFNSATATSPVGGSNGSSGSSGTNAGAIAGGVVGGVVGAALIALGVFFLLRHQRNQHTRVIGGGAGTDLASSPYDGPSPGGQHSPLMGQKEEYTMPVPYTPHAVGYDQTSPMPQPKLYDPNDPSTFPTSPAPALINNQMTGQTYTSNYPPPGIAPGNASGMYRGVAEV
ncbi:hypothetical protein DFH11DRAFT_1132575 [Phellopilus nigrolimitatus]|nr:hypothetical protein DFH11DRAFT_1132575 [Phellopilus nigrolimitatus]